MQTTHPPQWHNVICERPLKLNLSKLDSLASLDMDHSHLQLHCLDKDLFDSRHKANKNLIINIDENFFDHGKATFTKVSVDFRLIAKLDQTDFHMNNQNHILEINSLDTDKASLDMNHFDLQLDSLDMDLFDYRQYTNWNQTNLVETPKLSKLNSD